MKENLINKELRALWNASRGIYLGLKEERHIQIQWFVLFALFVSCFIWKSLSFLFACFCFIWLALMSLELLNSAIERICDLIDPDFNEQIRNIKDMAAAAVLLGLIAFAVLVATLIIFSL